MKRKQLYLDSAQDAKVKRLAHARQVTESDVVRSAIDALPVESAPRVAYRDPQAWARARAFMKQLATCDSLGTPGRTRQWTRDELYESRRPGARR